MLSLDNATFYYEHHKDDDIKSRTQKQNREKFIHPESDHLTLLNLYRGWKKAGDKRTFSNEHGLNGHSFAQTEKIRDQLKSLLSAVGITHVSSCANINGSTGSASDRNAALDPVRKCFVK